MLSVILSLGQMCINAQRRVAVLLGHFGNAKWTHLWVFGHFGALRVVAIVRHWTSNDEISYMRLQVVSII